MSNHPVDIPLFIDGEFVASRSAEYSEVVNPATQAVLARVPMATPDEVQVAAAQAAFSTWRKTPIGARAPLFTLSAVDS
ncbi:Methylmalonate semialdehyde dehydrogenase acylating [Tepidimonas charontis]|uniref:Methylmalonate semialdehyde dehydrogenase acylating n=1 Tax=Tepidimonas charontis TaxID=2267262 RepID=A0A554X753_9BURK|nr:Methylmalonate semialdehyde dehydrogenase acylating [Tepidimonas charontis]